MLQDKSHQECARVRHLIKIHVASLKWIFFLFIVIIYVFDFSNSCLWGCGNKLLFLLWTIYNGTRNIKKEFSKAVLTTSRLGKAHGYGKLSATVLHIFQSEKIQVLDQKKLHKKIKTSNMNHNFFKFMLLLKNHKVKFQHSFMNLKFK